MLQKVYSKSQVLDPYIMDVDALKEYSTSGMGSFHFHCPETGMCIKWVSLSDCIYLFAVVASMSISPRCIEHKSHIE